MVDKETAFSCKKNYLGASSLMFGIFAISGCWIPLLNILSISFAVIGLMFGIWSLIKVLCVKIKAFDKIIISGCGVLVSAVAIITAVFMNSTIFASHGGIKNFMVEVMDSMAGKNIGGNSKISSADNQQSANDVNFLNQTGNLSSHTYKIGESAELEGRKLTLIDVQKKFSMNNEYSVPKQGSQFVKVAVKFENDSDSDVTVSPYELKIQDNSGAIESMASVTYLSDDQLESSTLVPGGFREGAVIFEVPENDENLKLIYQLPSSETKVEFDLQ